MKMKRKIKGLHLSKYKPLSGLSFLVLLVFCAINAHSQNNIEARLTVVDGIASETPINNAQFQVQLFATGGGIASGARNVTYTIGGSAALTEYSPALSGSVLIPSGQSIGFINIAGIIDDSLVEGNETVIITLTAGFGANYDLEPIIANRTKQILIEDNDKGVISLDLNKPPFDDVATEGPSGDNGLFRITLDKPNGSAAPVTVNYTVTASATSGSGYTLTGAVVLTFANNGTQVIRNINVIPLNDLVSEPDQIVTLTLTGTDNLDLFTASGSASVTIFDDDCAAGGSAPVLTNNAITDYCNPPSASINLNTLITGGVNGGPGGAAAPLRWSLVQNPTVSTQLLANATVTSSNTYYGLYWDNTNTCASPSVQVVVTLNTLPDAGASINTSRCNESGFPGNPTAINLQNTLQGEDAGGTWAWVPGGPANVPISGATVVNFNNQPAGTYTYRYTLTGAGACGNDTADIVITVAGCDPCTGIVGTTAPVIDTSIPTVFCDMVDANISLNDYTNSTPPVGTQLRWALDENDPTNSFVTAARVADPLPGTYYGFFYAAPNCASPLLEVSLSQFTTPTITATSQNVTRCGPGTVTLTATVTGNPTINWYDAATGGSIVGTGANFTTPSISQSLSYWVEATENNCKTSPRVEVPVVIIPQPSAGIPIDTSSCSDPAYGNTVLNLNGQLEGADPGIWAFTSGPANVDPGNGEAVDFTGSPDGIYVFTYTTTGAEAPCENESASVTISVSNCDTDDDGDGLFGGTEQALGTDPQNADTDEDGIQDGVEVGDDINNPLDEDQDGIIDALDSNILDIDNDGVVDQLDPANENPCIPSRLNGVCDFDNDDITDSEEEANGSDPDDPCSPNPDHENCSPIDLEILKVVDNENAVVGDNVTFTVTVTNLDPSRKARSIKIGDLLEVGFEYVSNIVSSGSFDVATSEWNIPELGPTDSATLSMVVLILEGGPYTNTATLISSLPEDETLANNEAMAQVNIDLPVGVDLEVLKWARIKKDPDSNSSLIDQINPLNGEQIVFVIKVTNKSLEGTEITRIEIEDILPGPGQQWFRHDSHVVLASDESIGPYDMQSGIWEIPKLGLGEEAILEITGTVQLLDNTSQQETYTNTARWVKSSPTDGVLENNEDSVIVQISQPNPAEVGFLYNQFSPNADGTNDFLELNLTDFEQNPTVDRSISYNVQIFNRYGNLVFDGKNMTVAEVWDGSWKGKEAPDGTYYYVMNLDVDDGNGSQTKKGWIQLIR